MAVSANNIPMPAPSLTLSALPDTYAISTHDTDYLIVPEDALERALSVLSAQGHRLD